MLTLKNIKLVESKEELNKIPPGKVLINTINAHSYNVAQKDVFFAKALIGGDFLIPDGISVVKSCKWLHAKSMPTERLTGWDLFEFEMNRINTSKQYDSFGELALNPIVMFVGSSQSVLDKIVEKVGDIYPNLKIVTYSPPFKQELSENDSRNIIDAINKTKPDLLWIGMTAPKQEKWAYKYWPELSVNCHVGTIGAVFDFFAGTKRRAPEWWQEHSLEWLYRLLKEPKRMWKRYILGNLLFIYYITREKFSN